MPRFLRAATHRGPQPAPRPPPRHPGRDWRGRGLATRAVLLVCGYAAGVGAREAVIQVEPGNPASAAVARRAGFAPGGRRRRLDGTVFDWHTRDLHGDVP
ncbi:GNAT family protein [Longispora sp. NPDC051575]|uniref:GNAT family N-acetyltransferase n=1 Tax=Longispora sp. NPDC051575 TaxID=3154943 RepID=UPI00342D2555